MTARATERGVVYFNVGKACLERLVVSLHSLRQHWRGAVCVLNAGAPDPILERACRNCDALLSVIPDTGLRPLVAKVASLPHSPFAETVFLDADTLVVGPLDEFFALLSGAPFVFTRFADWQAGSGIVRKRMDAWRGSGIVPDALIDRARSHPAINVGTFAYRKHPFLEHWREMAALGAQRRLFIPDEIAAQIHLPELDHALAPAEFGVSVRHGRSSPDNRVIHYHGRKHARHFPLCALWKKARSALDALYPDFSGHPAPSDTALPATVVTAVDRAYLKTFRANALGWGFLSEHPLLVIARDIAPCELDFLRAASVRIHPWNWSAPGGNRESMLTAFVKLVPQIVETPFWIKLDADCAASEGARLFPEIGDGEYDVVGHRWGYTKPGAWLRTLEDWGDNALGSPRLFTEKELSAADRAIRYRHERIQSFVCRYRTAFTREAAALTGERLPVPSEDTYHWYVAKRLGRPILRVNAKQWGLRHPVKH